MRNLQCSFGNSAMKFLSITIFTTVLTIAVLVAPRDASPLEWSITEFHYQYGNLDAPSFAGGGNMETHILTFQHASGWKYGDTFLFIDFLEDSRQDGFNDDDMYGEAYFNFSLGKILGTTVGAGPVKDVGLLAGINLGADAKMVKYLPGMRLSWDIPGFSFLNLDVTAYIDHSRGADSGGAPKESDSFYIDVNGSYPLQIKTHRFAIEGHLEYIGKRENEFGGPVHGWFLAQPQFRWDIGNEFNYPDHVYLGVEWQVWINKLGDGKTDENAVQFLAVWRF